MTANEVIIDKIIAEAIDDVPKPSLAEMELSLAKQASDIEMSQAALLAAGLRSEPHKERIERIAHLRAAARFLGSCIHEPFKVSDRLRDVARGKKSSDR